MTTHELRMKLHELNYPETFEVDTETYSNVCDELFKLKLIKLIEFNGDKEPGYMNWIDISVGKRGGVFFKNVELTLKGANSAN